MNTCCKPLESAIMDLNIEISQKGTKYQIFGLPLDDMTEQLTITHCPFCGKKLSPLTHKQNIM